MKINDYGQVEITAEEAFQSLYSGKINSLDQVYIAGPEKEQFNQAKTANGDRFNELETLITPAATVAEFDALKKSFPVSSEIKAKVVKAKKETKPKKSKK